MHATVHAPSQPRAALFWNTGGGYELNAALIAAITALVDAGPGSPSVDRSIGLRGGSGWALAALAAGAAGSAAAIEAGARAGQDEEIPRTGRFTRQPQPAEETVSA